MKLLHKKIQFSNDREFKSLITSKVIYWTYKNCKKTDIAT